MILVAWLACTSDVDVDTDTGVPEMTHRVGICDIWQADALRSPEDLDADAWGLDEMVALGSGLGRPHRTRGQAFTWNIVQRSAGGVMDWTLPDHIVAASQARGIDLVVTVYPFAEDVPLAEAPPGLVPLIMPADEAGWRAFVRAMAERYDADGVDDMPGLERPVRYWEIGNEAACHEGDTTCYQNLLDLVRTAYEEIHTAQPDAIVVPAGAAPLNTADLGGEPIVLYTWFVAQGGLAYTDAFAFHMATGLSEPTLDAYVDRWRGIVGDVPMWLGEVASRSLYDTSIVYRSDPEREAAWLVDQFEASEALGLEKAFWCRTGGRLDWAPLALDAMTAYIAGLEE